MLLPHEVFLQIHNFSLSFLFNVKIFVKRDFSTLRILEVLHLVDSHKIAFRVIFYTFQDYFFKFLLLFYQVAIFIMYSVQDTNTRIPHL